MDWMQCKRVEMTFQAENAHTDVAGEEESSRDRGGQRWLRLVFLLFFLPHMLWAVALSQSDMTE